jgi:NAD(P)-dependent dehydrogenase (short-subunit alcohol dehydrogenase family)
MGALDGRVVVVSIEEEAAARALAARGATVVVVGTDAVRAGALVGAVEAGGGRASAFTGDPDDDAQADALAEMLAELFPE